MALYAFDGTWNTEKTKDNASTNTNVVRFKNASKADALKAIDAASKAASEPTRRLT